MNKNSALSFTSLSMAIAFSTALVAAPVIAADKEVQDMSDPLAIYTQAGLGFTDKGVNIKIGQSYDTGVATTAGMNVVEIKGIYGDALGWRGDDITTDSVDSFRFRNFSTNLTNFRAKQIDANLTLKQNLVAEKSADISYSLIQALPPMGILTLYPLAGAGVSMGENVLEDDGTIDSGYSIMGFYGLVGMYSKLAITDKIWLNYNPFWLATISGSDNYENNYYGVDQGDILTHEFALSYQLSPRFNIRLFANWNENVDFSDGDHRIEFNYQL